MRRSLFIVVSLISLFVCAATVTLWVAGDISRRSFHFDRESETFTLHSESGCAYFLYGRSAANVSVKPSVDLLGYGCFTVINRGTDNIPKDYPGYAVTVFAGPLWPIAAIFAPLPLWAAISMFLRRRIAQQNAENVCGSCGYNLTANLSGICPECGTAVARKLIAVG